MKVLWFTPIQLPAEKQGAAMSGGWMEGLRAALERYEPAIELVVASWGTTPHAPIRQGNSRYVSIHAGERRGRLAGFASGWRHGAVPPGAVADCRRIIAEAAPDLIHVHGSETFLGLALEGTDVPAVVSLQGIASVYVEHWFDGLRAGDFARLLADPALLHGYGVYHDYLRYRSRARCEARVLAACGDYMGRTEWDRVVVESLRPGARYHHGGEILDDVFYETAWDPATDGSPVVYCTSGSRPVKGLETLLDAVEILRARGVSLRLRVAGAVRSGSLWPVIRRRLRRPGLEGSVELLGSLPATSIARELAAASLYVHPAHIDNSPNALCEAMLVGVPCVAAHVGGIPSLVDPQETGLLYHDRDPWALAGCIHRLLEDRTLAERLGRAAAAAAAPRHDRETVARGVTAAYRAVAG